MAIGRLADTSWKPSLDEAVHVQAVEVVEVEAASSKPPAAIVEGGKPQAELGKRRELRQAKRMDVNKKMPEDIL